MTVRQSATARKRSQENKVRVAAIQALFFQATVLVQRFLRRSILGIIPASVSCYDSLQRSLEAEWKNTRIRPESRSPAAGPAV